MLWAKRLKAGRRYELGHLDTDGCCLWRLDGIAAFSLTLSTGLNGLRVGRYRKSSAVQLRYLHFWATQLTKEVIGVWLGCLKKSVSAPT